MDKRTSGAIDRMLVAADLLREAGESDAETKLIDLASSLLPDTLTICHTDEGGWDLANVP